MPRFLVYVDADSIDTISEAFDQLDAGYVEEYFTLTQDGKPIVFEAGQVSNPEWCNRIAKRCKGIAE